MRAGESMLGNVSEEIQMVKERGVIVVNKVDKCNSLETYSGPQTGDPGTPKVEPVPQLPMQSDVSANEDSLEMFTSLNPLFEPVVVGGSKDTGIDVKEAVDTAKEVNKRQGTEVVQEGSLGLAKDHLSKYHLLLIPVRTPQGIIQVLVDSGATGEFISKEYAKVLGGRRLKDQKINIELAEGS